MGGLLRSIRSITTQARHSTAGYAGLECRVDECDADRARIREDIREIKAALLVMGAPLEGDIPPELSCAVISGCRGPVTLDVDGQTVIAGLDPDRPGDVIEIWRALKGLAGGQDVAS